MMKLDVDFTQGELEVLAQIAKRFPRTSQESLKEDKIELLLADYEYSAAKSAMEKIVRKCSDDGVYINAMRLR